MRLPAVDEEARREEEANRISADTATATCRAKGRRRAARGRASGPKADAQAVISKACAQEHEDELRKAEKDRVAHEVKLAEWRCVADAISRGD